MDREIADIAAITGSGEPPSFANTIEALERSGRLPNTVGDLFHNLSKCERHQQGIGRGGPGLCAKAGGASQPDRALDRVLFARIDALYQKRDALGLAPDQLRLLERYHLRLVRAGALLGPAEKTRMAKEITTRMASLHTHFGQNVQFDEDEWRLVLDDAELAGLPDFAREAAAGAARERGLDGKYVITLSRSSVEPFLTFSARRDLREIAYRAWVAQRGEHRGEHDNAPLIAELLTLRQEQARLLGYDSYAAYRLDDTMAKTPNAAEHLLEQVWEPAKQRAAAERARNWPPRPTPTGSTGRSRPGIGAITPRRCVPRPTSSMRAR